MTSRMAAENGRGELILKTSIAIAVIVTFAIILRFIARKRTIAALGTDDWVILSSLVPAYAMLVIASIFIKKGGAGRHDGELGRSQLTLILKLLMPAIITHGLTVTCVKISVLLLYRRIFATEAFGRFTLVVGALCIVWVVANIFGQVFLCSPISAAWDPNLIFTEKCKDVQAMYYGVSISNMLLDMVILCLPLPLIWGLPLSRSKKFGLCGIFSLGSLTCIASLLRITSIGDMKHEDFPYTILMTYFWSHLEPSIAICTACLMTYRPLFRLHATQAAGTLLQTNPQSHATGSSTNRTANVGGGVWPLPPPPISRELRLDPRPNHPGQRSNLTGADIELEVLTRREDQETQRGTRREREARRDEYEGSGIIVGEAASFV